MKKEQKPAAAFIIFVIFLGTNVPLFHNTDLNVNKIRMKDAKLTIKSQLQEFMGEINPKTICAETSQGYPWLVGTSVK